MRSRTTHCLALAAGVVLLAAAPARAADSVPALFKQSYDLETRGDTAAALATIDRVPASGDVAYVLHLRKGWLLYLGGRYGDAVSAYNRAIDLEPSAAEPRLGVLLPLMAQRRWKEAERQAETVLARTPGDFTALSRLAYIHYNLGRYVESEGEYRKALSAFPANVEMRAGLGWALLKQGRLREARAEFDRALVVAPELASAKEGAAAIP